MRPSLCILVLFTICRAAEQPDQVITLERTACFGFCPVYSFQIDSSGTVSWQGKEYVATRGSQASSITHDQFRDLIEAFEQIRFFDLKDVYRLSPRGVFPN